MTMVDAPTLLTVIYVLVDDWYQDQGKRLVPPVSALSALRPAFSDSEVLTLPLAMDYFPYPGEQQFLGFIRANHLSLFPTLLGAKPVQSSRAPPGRVARSIAPLLSSADGGAV